MTGLRSPYEWTRVGRGSELQFFATDDEVTDILTQALPPAFAPYRVIGRVATKPPDHGSVEWRIFECDLPEAVESVRRLDAGPVWLAAAVTPSGGPTRDDEEARSLTGLVLIDPGLVRRGAKEAARIAFVRRVRNLLSGTTEENEDYAHIWAALRAAIKSRLRWTTIHTFPDGIAREDATLKLMTDGAAEAARVTPAEWSVQPGRPLPEPSRLPRGRGHVTG